MAALSQVSTAREILEPPSSLKKADGGPGVGTSCTGLLNLALFIIACVAVTGHMSGVVAGGCAVGLGVPSLLLSCKGFYDKQQEMVGQFTAGDLPPEQAETTLKVMKVIFALSSILSLAVVTIGALGIAGIVSATTVGWVILAPTLAFWATVCCCIPLCCCFACAGGVAAAAAGSTRNNS